MLINTTI